MRNKKPLGIYLHIPFCIRKCNYCDFLSAPAEEKTRHRYVQRLAEEIRQFDGADEYEVKSVFFGGGTPSVLDGEEIAFLMEALKGLFVFESRTRSGAMRGADAGADGGILDKRMQGEPEVTIECNPGTLTFEKLKIYRDCGINRLSLGLQSADAEELKILGRIHTWEDFLRNFEQARAMEFSNINIDLMSALPGQSIASWQRTLRKTASLKPEHISAYSLMIEEGTPFFEQYGQEAEDPVCGRFGRHAPRLPSEEEEREMYYDTKRLLEDAGYCRYEISNYARPGYESIHNSGYWRRREYVGFGLGASSQLKKMRCKNTERLEEYLNGDFSKRETETLTRQDEMEETMYLGLRMTQGVSLRKFREDFGISPEVLYKETIEKLERQGLLRISGGRLQLTDKGIDVSNVALAEFLL